MAFAYELAPGIYFWGATPELLLEVRGSTLETHALAGTRARGDSPERDFSLGAELLSSRKELEEHQLVVEAVRHRLEGSVEKLEWGTNPRLLKLSRVQHLVTDFKGQLSEASNPTEVIRALHPTPAVCGTPRSLARDWLRTNESLVRGWYSGPIGWRSLNGDSTFRVALRCARMSPRQMVAYAGAGIVAGSDPEAEWEETSLKLSTMNRCAVQEKDSE